MTNVKPGDLAKVLPGNCQPEFVGAQVLVIGPAESKYIESPAVIWEAELLQTVVAKCDTGGWKTGAVLRAGMHIACADHRLKRLDPPPEESYEGVQHADRVDS